MWGKLQRCPGGGGRSAPVSDLEPHARGVSDLGWARGHIADAIKTRGRSRTVTSLPRRRPWRRRAVGNIRGPRARDEKPPTHIYLQGPTENREGPLTRVTSAAHISREGHSDSGLSVEVRIRHWRCRATCMPDDNRFVDVLKSVGPKPHFYIGCTSEVQARLADRNAGRSTTPPGIVPGSAT